MSRDRRTTASWVVSLALTAAAVSAATLMFAGAVAPVAAQPAQPGGVILMRCALGTSEATVLVYQKSQQAPTKRSNNCAQTLADALNAGFQIEHAEISVDADQIVYTLIH